MKRDDMNRHLRDELARIPRGNYSQNVLRSIYNMQRRSDLGRDPRITRSASLGAAIRFMRKEHPTFEANFDRAYFAP